MAGMEAPDGPAGCASLSKEKPEHLTYLQDFRVEPCSQFKQHTCQNHRPYTCFYWHFTNQRRRRSVLRPDGTFNYSPDVYCVKYDESTGLCPDDDKCVYLHRVYGDVERKFHLRYYKTTLCVHATDSSKQCVKNGVHCPFAHGPDDIREPVFEVRDNEITAMDRQQGGIELLDNRDRLSYVVEDPIWEDQDHVLAYYKTDLCKKPPRLCRQGYACPFYHNSKDRRRSPLDFKYRSTPCPSVKHADEWSSPEACDSGDGCSYCHTRTEQQFHPEIYKSSKCNDILLHGYCPRSTFCAFAHTDAELCADRVLSKKQRLESNASTMSGFPSPSSDTANLFVGAASSDTCRNQRGSSPYADIFSNRPNLDASLSYSAALKQQRRYTMPTPRSGKMESDNDVLFSYPKAPGFERGLQSPYRNRACSALLPATGGGGGSGDKSMRPIFGFYDLANYDSGILSSSHNLTTEYLSPPSFGAVSSSNAKVEQMENLDALIGSLADELNMDDVLLPTISENEEKGYDTFPFVTVTSSGAVGDHHKKAAGVFEQTYSSYGEATASTACNGFFGLQEDNTLMQCNRSIGSFAPASGATGFRESISSFVTSQQQQQSSDPMLAFNEKSLTSRFAGMDIDECLLRTTKTCEVWKREAEEQRRRAQIAEQEKLQALNERDKVLNQLTRMQLEVQMLKTGTLTRGISTESMSVVQLEDLKSRLQVELDKVNRRLENSAGPMCARCGRHVNDRLPSVHCPVCTPSCKVGSSSSAIA